MIDFSKIAVLRYLPFLILGICVEAYLPDFFWLFIVAITLFQLPFILHKQRFFVLLLIQLILFIFPFCLQYQHQINYPELPQKPISGKFIVHSVWKQQQEKQQLIIQIHQQKILVYLQSKATFLPNDTLVLSKVKLQDLPEFKLNNFDYQVYLQEQGIQKVIYVKKAQRIAGKPPSNWLNKIKLWRIQQAHQVHFNKHLADKSKALYLALAFGDKNLLHFTLKQSFVQTGLYHVLAISGLHVGIVYVVLLFVLQLVKLRLGWVNFVIVCFFLIGYSIVAGNSVSVNRALVMFACLHFAKCFSIRQNTLQSTLLSAFILLLYQPKYLFSPGFQLSYIAVIALIIYLPKTQFFCAFFVSKYCANRYLAKLTIYVYNLILVSGIAFFATAPILLYHVGKIYPLGIISSIVFIPFFTLLVVFIFVIFVLAIFALANPVFPILNIIQLKLIALLEYLAPYSVPIEYAPSITQVIAWYLLCLAPLIRLKNKYVVITSTGIAIILLIT